MKGNQKLAVHVAVFSSTHVILEMVQSRLLHAQCKNRFLSNVLRYNDAYMRLVANPVEWTVKSNS